MSHFLLLSNDAWACSSSFQPPKLELYLGLEDSLLYTEHSHYKNRLNKRQKNIICYWASLPFTETWTNTSAWQRIETIWRLHKYHTTHVAKKYAQSLLKFIIYATALLKRFYLHSDLSLGSYYIPEPYSKEQLAFAWNKNLDIINVLQMYNVWVHCKCMPLIFPKF